MRTIMRVALAMLALLLLSPELARYSGERTLRRMRESTAADSVRTYPGDWRPLVFAAKASFSAREYGRAADLFERANELGVRPDIDVNLGLVYARLGDRTRSNAYLSRGFLYAPGFRKLLVEDMKIVKQKPQ